MNERFIQFLADETGGPTAEYALIAVFFACATIVSLKLVSTQASHQLTTTQTNLMNNVVTPP